MKSSDFSSTLAGKSDLSICALILCAGTGSRTGLSYNKLLHYVGRKTILEITLDRFAQSRVDSVFLAINPRDEQAIRELTKPYKHIHIVYGGETRSDSVRRGLDEISYCDVVVIHDGARPYVTPNVIDDSIESAIRYGSGIVAVPTVDTIKEVKNNEIVRSLSRAGLFNIQTPQSFAFNYIADAYNRIEGNFTDDSEVYERAGYTPKIVIGDYENVKVTSPADLYRGAPARTKIGVGFDVHPLCAGYDLVLGGVKIPHAKGLKGHSDADVLIHAIMDALLSAAGMADIGVLFPDTSPAYQGIASTILLSQVCELVKQHFIIGNVSAVIMAQKPKMSPHIAAMRQTLAQTMGIHPDQINISATTTENLGIIGNEKGIAASATCLLFN
ncbi:MAG: 2-C-methyl-D-erythritol 2,4-cyclodiphosphate synthase [Clostridiales bacterium]|nr:2-C-methyl-D-erythritol 2,4-cyclodiphosphate synthase [Clostridiales bacterium]